MSNRRRRPQTSELPVDRAADRPAVKGAVAAEQDTVLLLAAAAVAVAEQVRWSVRHARQRKERDVRQPQSTSVATKARNTTER